MALIGPRPMSGFQGEVVYVIYLLTFVFVCFELQVVVGLLRSMNSVFKQSQLLHCHTIEQCLILDADVHKGVSNTRCGRPQESKTHAGKGEEVGKQVFLMTSF